MSDPPLDLSNLIVEKIDTNLIDFTPDHPEPPLDEVERRGLVASLIQHGGNVLPVVLCENPDAPGRYLVIDGRHRVVGLRHARLPLTAVVLKTPPTQDQLDVLIVHLQNTTRRPDKGEIAARMFAWLRREPGRTQVLAAALFHVKEPYAAKLLSGYKTGIPALIEAFEKKQIVTTAVPYLAALTPEQQAEALPVCMRKPRKFIEKFVRRYKPQKPQRKERFAKLAVGGVRVWVPAERQVDLLEAFALRVLEAVKKVRKNGLLEKALPELLAAS